MHQGRERSTLGSADILARPRPCKKVQPPECSRVEFHGTGGGGIASGALVSPDDFLIRTVGGRTPRPPRLPKGHTLFGNPLRVHPVQPGKFRVRQTFGKLLFKQLIEVEAERVQNIQKISATGRERLFDLRQRSRPFHRPKQFGVMHDPAVAAVIDNDVFAMHPDAVFRKRHLLSHIKLPDEAHDFQSMEFHRIF